MITLTRPGPALARACLDTGGGFCWWYADVVDAAGNGVVVIAGFGLPFLPGVAGAARRGAPVVPSARPSVNLAVYEAGRCTWYGLLELPPSSSSWSTAADAGAGADGLIEEQRFGDCRFARRVVGDVAEFVATLDVALPYGRARGTVVVRGRARGPAEQDALDVAADGARPHSATEAPRHDWCPQILHAHGAVDLTLGDAGAGWPERRVVVAGRGYHDRNGALAPLHDLGIDHWCWVRSSLPHEDRVLYALWPTDGIGRGGAPRAFGLVVDDRGSRVVPDLRLQVRRAPVNWLSLRRIDELVAFAGDDAPVPFVHVRALHVVDDGPFYARALCASSTTAQPPSSTITDGVMETVTPHRVDVPWQRPFVRMRVTPPAPQALSPWHPLFVGDAQGRVGRLVRSFAAGRA